MRTRSWHQLVVGAAAVCLVVSIAWADGFENPAKPPVVRGTAAEELFGTPFVVATEFVAADEKSSSAGLRPEVPRALTSGDFDGDGVADLVSAYSDDDGGWFAVHRGNIDALYPHSPAARAVRRQKGHALLPFHAEAPGVRTAAPADFIAAGDFDADGRLDLVTAARTSTDLWLYRGDGGGGFGPAEALSLPGRPTALIAGEIHRADGLLDLIVGIESTGKAQVLIYQGPRGAWLSPAETIALPEPASSLALGRFYDGSWIDLAIAAGSELVVVQGRDRQLLLEESRRAATGPSVVERMAMPAEIEALAWGDFALESAFRRELAVLLVDSSVRVLSAEVGAWFDVGTISLETPVTREGGARAARLIATRMSGSSTQDLLVLAADGEELRLISGVRRGDSGELADHGYATSLDLTAAAAAVAPMRLDGNALTDLAMLQDGASGPSVSSGTPLASIVVDTDADTEVAGDGACSLREAINNANGDSDTTSGDCASGAGNDEILFAIGGGGSTATIEPLTPLPAIEDPVTVDGVSQGCPTAPCIALDGTLVASIGPGLRLEAGSSVVRGLAAYAFRNVGIASSGPGNIIEGNHVGVDLTGTIDRGNEFDGVRIDGTLDNIIGGTTEFSRNVISGNGRHGAYLQAIFTTASDHRIVGNHIGTDLSGEVALPNDESGVLLVGQVGAEIGGTEAGERNLISGNVLLGVDIGIPGDSGNRANLVQGNFIGTDVGGTVAIPNLYSGIQIITPDNTVGGTVAAARNLISGNDGDGVFLTGRGAGGNEIIGNYIGTDITGLAPLGNEFICVEFNSTEANTVGGAVEGAGNVCAASRMYGGVSFFDSPNMNVLGNFIGTDATGTLALGNTQSGVVARESIGATIGGTTPEARNVISGNGWAGVKLVDSADSEVLGNLIGTDISGTYDLANGRSGVTIDGGSNITIGGTADGAPNLIAHNQESGVEVINDGAGHSIHCNSIGPNGLLGIDLGADGVTPNDPLDPDTGPNGLQNFPVLSTADATTTPDVTVGGSLNSTAGSTFEIEFFVSRGCDGSGYGEGARFLGSSSETTDGSGDVSFSVTLTEPVPDGDAIVATATGPDGSTSELSACIEASCSSLAVFPEMIMPENKDALVWATPQDVRFAEGPLSEVSTYTTTASGDLFAVDRLDISGDAPDPGQGLYYVLKLLGCGSWQTVEGDEPDRETTLP